MHFFYGADNKPAIVVYNSWTVTAFASRLTQSTCCDGGGHDGFSKAKPLDQLSILQAKNDDQSIWGYYADSLSALLPLVPKGVLD